MNVFLDTNVLMDVLLDRESFVVDAQQVWLLTPSEFLATNGFD